MLKNKIYLENIQNTNCPKCGTSLSSARLDTVFEAKSSLVAHAVCSACSTSSMVTVTPSGIGTVAIFSDLSGSEFKKFLIRQSINYKDVLDIHLLLKKESLWKLLQKKEK